MCLFYKGSLQLCSTLEPFKLVKTSKPYFLSLEVPSGNFRSALSDVEWLLSYSSFHKTIEDKQTLVEGEDIFIFLPIPQNKKQLRLGYFCMFIQTYNNNKRFIECDIKLGVSEDC